MKLTEIVLTPDEIHLAGVHGVFRRVNKYRLQRADREQGLPSDWINEIEGACAELAFCKMRGAFWEGVGKIRAKDAALVEIRWTRHDGTGGLILYPRDNPAAIYVAMDGHTPKYRIFGWLYGTEGMKPEYMTTDGYYLVPRAKLRPMPMATPESKSGVG